MAHDLASLRSLFDEVIQVPLESRAALLSARCGADSGLRRRVEALIATAEADEPFLSEPTRTKQSSSADSTFQATPLAERPGTRIGPYKLLQIIGEGGFGVVFLAEQEQPVRRRVALKVIKLGMDTRQIVARFEQERQALALMDHPNIARVFDAGVTESGRSYFAMEYIIGDPITEFADAHKLNVRQRLDLFAQICSAVQHAHAKGVIHRDIKPRNVLVSIVDGNPFAKVIDFGIAKATGARLTDKTLFTEHRQLVGTPEYMSPEQAEGSQDIDTRTDVYALGVLLYELLVGETPFDAKRLRSAAFGEMQRIIKEEEPLAPSMRLSRNLATLAATAAARHVEPSKLGTEIRGELDWIVMKCLEKDRARRYDTANSLALDVQRYLHNQPVIAGPTSASYRLRKFVKRNRVAVFSGSLVVVSLVTGLSVAVMQWVRADRAYAEAITERNRARDAEQVAQQRLLEVQRAQTKTEEVSDLLHHKFTEGRNRLKMLLDGGQIPEAELLCRQLLQTSSEILGDDHHETIDLTMELVRILLDQGRLAEGELIIEPLMSSIRQARASQPAGFDRFVRRLQEMLFSETLSQWGHCAEAEELCQTGAAPSTTEQPIDDLIIDHYFASVRMCQHRYDEAATLYRQILDRFSPPFQSTSEAEHLASYAHALERTGQFSKAESCAREAADIFAKNGKTDTREHIINNNVLGAALSGQHRFAVAEPILLESTEALQRDRGSPTPLMKECVDRVVNLYQGWDHVEPSKGYAEKAAQWRAKINSLR